MVEKDLPSFLPPIRHKSHQIDFIPGASLPNKAPYKLLLKMLKYPNKLQNYWIKDLFKKVLAHVLSHQFRLLKRMVNGDYALIVEPLTRSL